MTETNLSKQLMEYLWGKPFDFRLFTVDVDVRIKANAYFNFDGSGRSTSAGTSSRRERPVYSSTTDRSSGSTGGESFGSSWMNFIFPQSLSGTYNYGSHGGKNLSSSGTAAKLRTDSSSRRLDSHSYSRITNSFAAGGALKGSASSKSDWQSGRNFSYGGSSLLSGDVAQRKSFTSVKSSAPLVSTSRKTFAPIKTSDPMDLSLGYAQLRQARKDFRSSNSGSQSWQSGRNFSSGSANGQLGGHGGKSFALSSWDASVLSLNSGGSGAKKSFTSGTSGGGGGNRRLVRKK